MSADTSAEAVERKAAWLISCAETADFPPTVRIVLSACAATLRALLAERDRLAEAVRALDAAHAQAAREVERLRGIISEAVRCIGDGCEDEADRLLRAALAGEGRGDG